jgi:hypothetical protein
MQQGQIPVPPVVNISAMFSVDTEVSSMMPVQHVFQYVYQVVLKYLFYYLLWII